MDTKNLLKKGNCWYLNFTFPKGFSNEKLSGRKVRISLKTSEYKVARTFRDRYITKILTYDNSIDMLRGIAQMLVEAETEFTEELNAIIPALRLRTVRAGNSVTLRELCKKYLEHLQVKSKRKSSSISKYGASLKCLCFILGDDTPASEVTHDRIKYFVDTALMLPRAWSYKIEKMTLEDILSSEWNPTLSHNSVMGFLILAKQMYDWAIENELLRISMPFKKLNNYLESQEQEHKRAPTHDEAGKIMEMPCARNIGKDEWKLIPLISRYTGMRLAEVCQLHAEDVNIRDGILCFDICRDTKNKSSVRMVPVSEKILPVIKDFVAKVGSGRLFPRCGDRLSGTSIKYGHEFSKRFNIAVKKIHPELTFHSWRVYANTEMTRGLVSDIDRERILGHATASTNSVYLVEDIMRYKNAVDKIN